MELNELMVKLDLKFHIQINAVISRIMQSSRATNYVAHSHLNLKLLNFSYFQNAFFQRGKNRNVFNT